MQVKKQQLELDMEQQTGSKSGKEYVKAVYCHLAYLTSMQSASCEILGWMKHKLESREISITSDWPLLLWQKHYHADDITLMAESEEQLKSLWWKWKMNEKFGLKLNIQKSKTMASGPITSWQIDGKTMETECQTLFSWAPKSLQMVPAAMKLKDTCSLEEKLL